MRASWLVLTLSFFGCAAARVECPVHGGRQWLDVTTPHFHIRTNLSPGAAREQAQTLEQLLQAIRWVVDYAVDPRGIEVIAVEENDLESFGWKFNGRELGGQRMILESWSATSLRGRTASVPTHELAHVVVGQAYPSMPYWLNEGFATYLETATIRDELTVKLGTGHNVYGYYIWDKGLLDLATLEAWEHKLDLPDEAKWQRYGSAWAYVHYLANHERGRFLDLLEDFRQGRNGKKALARHFPDFESKIRPAAAAHIDGGKFTAVTLTLPEPAPEPVLAPLPPEEVHAVRRELWALSDTVRGGRREAQLRAETARALEVSGGKSLEVALALFDKGVLTEQALLEAFPGEARVHRAVALRAPVGDPAAVERVRELLRVAPEDELLLARRALERSATSEPDAERAALEALPGPRSARALCWLALAAAVRHDCTRLEKLAAELSARRAKGEAKKELDAVVPQLEKLCKQPSRPSLECSDGEDGVGNLLREQAGTVLALAEALRFYDPGARPPMGVALEFRLDADGKPRAPHARASGNGRTLALLQTALERATLARSFSRACQPSGVRRVAWELQGTDDVTLTVERELE